MCGNVGQVKDDVIVEGAESFSVLLSSQNVRVLIRQNTAQVTIEDDDGMCNSCLTQILVSRKEKRWRCVYAKCERVHIINVNV